MTRQVRVESATGIYHVILRGINRQNIFENPEDYEKLLRCLFDAKNKDGIKLYGYCLMTNHVHIIVGAGTEPISVSFKRIGVSYVSWYNRKYYRQGPLFQDRFKSEPIEDDSYLLLALRCIHQNPVKAGMCKSPEEYRWSSFTDYTGSGDGIADIEEVLAMFSKDPAAQSALFREFNREEEDVKFIDIDDACPSDEALKGRMIKICGVKSTGEFRAMNSNEKAHAIRLMRIDGMPMRQIVGLTGVPFGVVRAIRSAF
jgi:REP element-mobilizing transposase RayT